MRVCARRHACVHIQNMYTKVLKNLREYSITSELFCDQYSATFYKCYHFYKANIFKTHLFYGEGGIFIASLRTSNILLPRNAKVGFQLWGTNRSV